MDARERAARIRLVAFDVDGVMTDGSLTYSDDGREQKTFNVQDGFGIRLLREAGMIIAIVTGRSCGAVAARAADLGITLLRQGVADKALTLAEILEQHDIAWHECAFMGDDLIDLPPMIRCGLACAPASAREPVRRHAHLVTDAAGGHGAVREFCEYLLAAQGRLEAIIENHLQP